MHIKPPGTDAVGAINALRTPDLNPAAQAVFGRVKDALVTGDYAAFRAELHPTLLTGRPEEIAGFFTRYKKADPESWKLDRLYAGASIFAHVLEAPSYTFAHFAFDGDKLKLSSLSSVGL